jgi:hypothetical protein
MQLPSYILTLAAAATVLADPQGKFGAKGGNGGKGKLGGGAEAGAGAAGCSPLEIVYARATTEPQGLGMVGAPLLSATRRLIPGVTAYAVRYPATFGAKSPEDGVRDILAYFERKPKACPDQK